MCFKWSSIVELLFAALFLQCSLSFASHPFNLHHVSYRTESINTVAAPVLCRSMFMFSVWLKCLLGSLNLKCFGPRLQARECLTFPYKVEVATFLPCCVFQWSVNNAANCLVFKTKQKPMQGSVKDRMRYSL